MSELAQLIEYIPPSWKTAIVPALTSLCTFVGACRFFVKPFGNWLKAVSTRAAERASLSLDREDDTVIESILRTRAYRIFAFLLDLFASVKLPAAEDLFQPKP